MSSVKRRSLLSLPALAVLGVAASGCGEDEPVAETDRGESPPESLPDGPVPTRVAYGADPSQYADLYLPAGPPRGVVVVVHGGFWLELYDLSLGAPLASSLAAEGWAAWNLEYRRVGNGGGDPETFDDIAAGIDALAGNAAELGVDLDLTTVVTLGHSAGGHLAAWAASRGRSRRWADAVAVTHVVSQAGVLDLAAAHEAGLGSGAVERFLGHAPGPDDVPLDPRRQLPLDVPVWCVHGRDDASVPISQSEDYVAAATAAGARAELVAVEGDHFVVIDPASEAWARTLAILDTIA